VVVLGPTGINFAAGMSGGIAYVLDVDGRFRERCNTELVGFDTITPDEALELRGWIEEHERRTGSTVARALLADWERQLERFVKVMPHDYKRALAELADRRGRLPSEQAEPLAVGAVAANSDGQGVAVAGSAAEGGSDTAGHVPAGS